MGEVYPNESELIDDPYKLFITPKQWKSKSIKKKLVYGVRGESFSGKSYGLLSTSHLTEKFIRNDFKSMNSKLRDEFIQWLKDNFLPFTPLWVIGTEESTHEILTSFDNEEYFEHANINYVEILQKAEGGLTLLDHINTYKQFLIAIYSLSNITRGSIIVDSATTILNAQHEVVRRVIGKIPTLKKEQGILPRYWFWRNVEQEGMMFYGRIVKAHFFFSVKDIIQHTEDGQDIEKTKWHEETNRHLASIIVKNERQSKTEPIFRSTIEKCRIDSSLYGKTFQSMTMPMFMYNLFLTYKERIKNREVANDKDK